MGSKKLSKKQANELIDLINKYEEEQLLINYLEHLEDNNESGVSLLVRGYNEVS